MLDKNPKLVNLKNSNGITSIPYLLSIEQYRLNLKNKRLVIYILYFSGYFILVYR